VRAPPRPERAGGPGSASRTTAQSRAPRPGTTQPTEYPPTAQPAPRSRGQLVLLPSHPAHRIVRYYEDVTAALASLEDVAGAIGAEVRLDIEERELENLVPLFVPALYRVLDLIDGVAWDMRRETGAA
jgi:hypothetical protein